MIKMKNKGSFAIAQIILLLLGMISIAWAIGSEVKIVEADGAVITKTLKVTFEDGKVGTYAEKVSGVYSRVEGPSNLPKDVVVTENRIYDSNMNPLGATAQDITEYPAQTPSATSLPVAAAPLVGEILNSPTPKSVLDYSQEEIDSILNRGDLTSSERAYLEGLRKDTYITPGEEVILTPQDRVHLEELRKQVRGDDAFLEGSQEAQDLQGQTGISSSQFTESSTKYSKFWAYKYGQGFFGNLAQGVVWAGAVVGAMQLVGNIVGVEQPILNAASGAAFGGIMAGKAIYGLMETGNMNFFSPAGGWDSASGYFELTKGQLTSVGIGVAVAAAIFIAMYKTESTEVVSFTCEPWEAPTGGSLCEQCNKQSILPCSEYQCRSLGQSCQLINKGTTEEKCAWVNRRDVTPPVIRLWNDALSKNHKYSPDTSVSPPDTGTKIVYNQAKDGCIKAFTPLEFGIITDEPASCKVDYQRKTTFDNMSYYLGGTPAFLYNHSQIMSLPGASNLVAENISIKSNGEYSLFVRCKDSNGNANTATFVFRFCVEKGPDTTPPLIVATNLINRMPVAYNKSSVEFETYTNEPASCRWSHVDQSFDKMEQKMVCSSSVLEMNAQLVYKCKTTLNSIKSEMENNFYIKCEDQPSKSESDRNRNTESYKFTIIGTKPLAITFVGPNGTVRDSTEIVKVTLQAKTFGGYQEGNSTCYYSPTEDTGDYIKFLNTHSHLHSQDLYLSEGDYTYYLKCVDLGGNADVNKTSFHVETDTESPLVVRAYNEESNLKIIADETSSCVYGMSDCVYEIKDGIAMSSIDENMTQHYTAWETGKTFYIKCQDKYGNEPSPNQCSIILKPTADLTVETEEED